MESGARRIQADARRGAGWVTTAFGFTIPLWTLADGLLLGLLALCWMGGGAWSEKFRRVASNPVAVAVLLLFGWILLGMLWGVGSLEDRATYAKKYAELLLIPVLISLCVTAQERARALFALAAGLGVTLVLSFLLGLNLVPSGSPFKGDPSNPFVFKKHITHNVLMAFGALLFTVLAWRSRDIRWRWGWGALAFLAACNVVLMVQGRTGYVVLAGLAVLALHRFFGWRGVTAAVVLLTAAFVGAFTLSSAFHQRIGQVTSGVTQWDPRSAAHDPIGERLEFYQHTLEIIREHPLLGVGTGGFPQAYAEHIGQAGMTATRNPHNQYLLIMAQVGVVGLGLLLWLFAQQWRSSLGFADAGDRLLVHGLVITIAVGCLFNSLLIDHTEKLLYCWLSGLYFSGAEPRPAATT